MFLKSTPVAIALSAVLVSACSAQSSSTSHAHTHTDNDYAKPGPALELSYDYDGESDTFSTERFTLTIADDYEDGTLTVIVDAGDDINLLSASTGSFSLAADGPAEMPVEFSAAQDGQYYLNIIMHADLPAGRQSSASVISVPVGGPSAREFSPQMVTTLTPEGERVIEMRAEETITTDD